jgi:hypothetical protein
LVRDFADWWNLNTQYLDMLEAGAIRDLRAQVGTARMSVQEMVSYVPEHGDREAITAITMKRFGYSRPTIGTGRELLEHFQRRAELGVERTYVWFCDFAPPETLAAFGREVIAKFAI